MCNRRLHVLRRYATMSCRLSTIEEREADMTAQPSRTFIAVMQVTVDGYILGPDGESDWVDSWADGLELLPQVDAFVLGGGMFPEYEQFWAAVRDDPATVAEWIGRDPYPREAAYARFAAETPHLVLSTTIEEVTWPSARIVRDIEEIRAFKAQPGNSVYVVGGPGLLRSLIGAGLVDELRLVVHPVAVGSGTSVFEGIGQRQALDLVATESGQSGRVYLTYRPKVLAVAEAA
jgi:dihydrofolate reductase